jgi:ATP-dependent HslUV protease ATP-binding subunit HslU
MAVNETETALEPYSPERDVEWLDELTPRQIVAELDKYIVGQDAAKRAVAIALRNRWRRQRVDDELREEILPNNIILIGPTGVGKTEIARRLARLAGAPFVKVEASKFTEVGYVGRDVESMVRDLVDIAVNMVRDEREAEVEELAQQRVEERLLDLLLPAPQDTPTATQTPSGGVSIPLWPTRAGSGPAGGTGGGDSTTPPPARAFVVGTDGGAREERVDDEAEDDDDEQRLKERRERTREKLRTLLREGKLEERTVDVEVSQSAPIENMMLPMGAEGMDFNLAEMLQDMLPKRKKRRTVSVAEARRILLQDELDKLVRLSRRQRRVPQSRWVVHRHRSGRALESEEPHQLGDAPRRWKTELLRQHVRLPRCNRFLRFRHDSAALLDHQRLRPFARGVVVGR